MLLYALACQSTAPVVTDPAPDPADPVDVVPTPVPDPPVATEPPEPPVDPVEPPEVPEQSDGFAYLPAAYDVDAPELIVFMGDSITRGEGATSTDRDYVDLLFGNDDDRFPGYVGADLVAWYPGIAHAVNVAVSGGTTDTLLDAEVPALQQWIETNVDGGRPTGQTVVFVTIGGNDLQAALVPFVDPQPLIDGALDNLEQTLDFLQDPAWFPGGTRVFVTNVYEPSDGVGRSGCFFGLDYSGRLADLERYNAGLHDLGQARGVAIVDLHGHFLGHGANAADANNPFYDASDPTRWFAGDCIHPNDAGHHQVRRLFLGAAGGTIVPYVP